MELFTDHVIVDPFQSETIIVLVKHSFELCAGERCTIVETGASPSVERSTLELRIVSHVSETKRRGQSLYKPR